MDLEQYAQESAAAINAALEKYRFDKLALQDAEQTAALARDVNGRMTNPEEPPIEIDLAGTNGLRASLEEQRRALIRLQNDRFRRWCILRSGNSSERAALRPHPGSVPCRGEPDADQE